DRCHRSPAEPPQGSRHEQRHNFGPRAGVNLFQERSVHQVKKVEQPDPADAGREMDPAQQELQKWREVLRWTDSRQLQRSKRQHIHSCFLPTVYQVLRMGWASVLKTTLSRFRVSRGANVRYRYFRVSARK